MWICLCTSTYDIYVDITRLCVDIYVVISTVIIIIIAILKKKKKMYTVGHKNMAVNF